jgi:hypothetical protein
VSHCSQLILPYQNEPGGNRGADPGYRWPPGRPEAQSDNRPYLSPVQRIDIGLIHSIASNMLQFINRAGPTYVTEYPILASSSRHPDGSDRRMNAFGDLSPGLIRTKLQRPRLGQDLIQRPRLIERLNDGLDRKLTLISAQAGAGKTTLLVQFPDRHKPGCQLHLIDGRKIG